MTQPTFGDWAQDRDPFRRGTVAPPQPDPRTQARRDDPATSHRAAETETQHRAAHREAVWQAVKQEGGLTYHEIGVRIGLDPVRAMRRLDDLQKAHLVEKGGPRGCRCGQCRGGLMSTWWRKA